MENWIILKVSHGVLTSTFDATLAYVRVEITVSKALNIYLCFQPFGKRSGSKVRNWVLYPRVLLELARVARLGTGRVCLLTMDKKCLQKVWI